MVLEWFVNGWQKLRKIVEEHQEYFNGQGKTCAKFIRDLTVFQQAEEALHCLKPVGVALDAMQADFVSIADGVEIWKNRLNKFRNSEQREWLLLADTRYNNAVSDVWFAANVLHPKYGWQQITQSELKLAMEFIKEFHEEALEDFVLFIGDENVKFYDEFKKNWWRENNKLCKSSSTAGQFIGKTW